MTTALGGTIREVHVIPGLLIAGTTYTATTATIELLTESTAVQPGDDRRPVIRPSSRSYHVMCRLEVSRTAVASGTTTKGDDTWAVVEPSASAARGVDLALLRLSRAISPIPEAIAVTHAIEGDINRVWTFVKSRDKSVRRRIYLEELRILDSFPEYSFDFNVAAVQDVPGCALLPDDLQGRIVFYREGQLRDGPA